MKKQRIPAGLFLSMACLCGLVLGCGTGSAGGVRTQAETSAKPAGPPQELGAEGQAALHGIVQAGNLADLRWPDFSDYGKHVEKFYEAYGYSLPWVRGMEPTAQAKQAIALLLTAEQRGLAAEDYDGPRWSERLAKLKPATAQPS